MQEDRAALNAARKQVELERSVNRKLLQCKADVEYQLMEAQAQLPLQSHTSQDEYHYMHATSSTPPAAASPNGSQTHMRDAGSLPFIRTSHDGQIARSRLLDSASPVSVTGSLPAHAYPTSDHQVQFEGYKSMPLHTTMHESVDNGAVERMHPVAVLRHSTGGVGAPVPDVMHGTEQRSQSSQGHRRTSPLQLCHSPAPQQAVGATIFPDHSFTASACSPAVEDGSTRVFGQSDLNASHQGRIRTSEMYSPTVPSGALTGVHATPHSTGAASNGCRDPQSADDFQHNVLHFSGGNTESQQGQYAYSAEIRSSLQGSGRRSRSQLPTEQVQVWASSPTHLGTTGSSVCSETDAGVMNEFVSSEAVHEQRSSASIPSLEKCQAASGVSSGFSNEEQQENVLLHANVVRHV
jgi:hypothetical protein